MPKRKLLKVERDCVTLGKLTLKGHPANIFAVALSVLVLIGGLIGTIAYVNAKFETMTKQRHALAWAIGFDTNEIAAIDEEAAK